MGPSPSRDFAPEPIAMLGSEGAEDAAGAYAQRLIEESEGAWTAGAVCIWESGQTVNEATIFDITARFFVSPDDESEIDCEVEIFGR